MRNAEGENHHSHEPVGAREIDLFERKVNQLLYHPKLDPDNSKNLTTAYKQGRTFLFLSTPKPEDNEDIEFLSFKETKILRTDVFFTNEENGHTFLKNQTYSLSHQDRLMEYDEEIMELDEDGNPIESAPQQKIKKDLREGDFSSYMQQLKDEKVLGIHIMTHEKFEDIMGLLNSLTPADEIEI